METERLSIVAFFPSLQTKLLPSVCFNRFSILSFPSTLEDGQHAACASLLFHLGKGPSQPARARPRRQQAVVVGDEMVSLALKMSGKFGERANVLTGEFVNIGSL